MAYTGHLTRTARSTFLANDNRPTDQPSDERVSVDQASGGEVDDAASPDASTGRFIAIRRNCMLSLLGFISCAAAYDYAVARRQPAQLNNALVTYASGRANQRGRQANSADIRDVAQRKPTRTLRGYMYDVEYFEWQSAVPWRQYYCAVVYTKYADKRTYYTHFFNQPIPNEFLPKEMRKSQPRRQPHPQLSEDEKREQMQMMMHRDAQYMDFYTKPPPDIAEELQRKKEEAEERAEPQESDETQQTLCGLDS